MNGNGEILDGGQASVLVVDDLPEKHLAYEAMLEGMGFKIVAVRSGADALRQILLQDFAVILLDVNMPEMDGFETARLIRQRKRSASTPIIFLTAFADEVRTAQGYATGAVDYLPTPVVPGILRAKVRVFVDLFEMRRQVAKQAEERAKQAAIEDSNRRLSFLADTATVLGSSLDIHATARDIVRLPIPFLADLSVLKLNSIVGDQPKWLISHVDASGAATFEEQPDSALPLSLTERMNKVMSEERAEFIKFASADGAFDGIILPLRARGRTFAVLALSFTSNGRNFDPNQIALAEAFSSRAAVALDNSLLHEEIRTADHQKNDFLSMLAHELRNPLAPIRNAAQLLDRSVLNEPDAKWACEVIERQVVQMVRLVDDLLDVARITRDKIQLHQEPVELKAVIDRALEASRPIIDLRQHRLSVDLPATPIWIVGDLVRLTQVLTNLLNNAAKYTEPGGDIRLSSSKEERFAVIRVRDNGIGIPSQKLESIFELFTQLDRALDRSHGGLGIGLTLVKRLVEMHGGTVEAHSEGPGSGSEFVVRLPALTNTLESQPLEEQGQPQDLASRRVLVVDDNRDSAETLSMMLRHMGHVAKAAYDGFEALELVQTYKPDTVLLDIGLPKMNGYEVCRRLREQSNGCRIVIAALTGWGQQEDQRRSAEAGFDRHLVKPINSAALEDLFTSSSIG